MVYLGSFLGEVSSLVINISAVIVLVVLVWLIRKFHDVFGFGKPEERNRFASIANKEEKLNRLQKKFFSRTIRELRRERRRIPYEMHELQGAKELAGVKRSHIFKMRSLISVWQESRSLQQRNNVVGEIHNNLGIVERLLEKQFDEYKVWMRAAHFAAKQALKAKKNLRKMLNTTIKEEKVAEEDTSEKGEPVLNKEEKEERREKKETKQGKRIWKEREQILKCMHEYKKILKTQKKALKNIDKELEKYLLVLHHEKSEESIGRESESLLSEPIGKIYKLLIEKEGLIAKANEEIALLDRIEKEEKKDWGLSRRTLRLLYGEKKIEGSAGTGELPYP